MELAAETQLLLILDDLQREFVARAIPPWLSDHRQNLTLKDWIFCSARVLDVVVSVLAVPALRTPTYLASWATVLMIAGSLVL